MWYCGEGPTVYHGQYPRRLSPAKRFKRTRKWASNQATARMRRIDLEMDEEKSETQIDANQNI